MPRATKSTRNTPGLPSTTFILDNGAYNIKAGFAPASHLASDSDALENCRTIPNTLVRIREKKTYIGVHCSEIAQWSEALFRRPVENGQVVSWETQKEIWDDAFFDPRTAPKELLVKNTQETTLLFTEMPNAMPELQKNADEIIMEEWGFGGYARVIGPSLNAYNDLHPVFEGEGYVQPSHNDPLADLPMDCLLVVDMGYSHTTVTPLVKGRPLQRAIRRLDFGGKHLTNLLKEVISVRHFDLHQDNKIVNDIKEDVFFVSDDFKRDLERTWKGNIKRYRQTPISTVKDDDNDDAIETDHDLSLLKGEQDPSLKIDYILPDGIRLLRGFSRPHEPATSTTLKKRKQALLSTDPSAPEISMTLSNERFSPPEILFSPSDIGSKQPSLPDTIMQSLSVLPPLIQATLLSNILVVGGTANIPGMVERLQAELRSRVKTEWMVRVRKMEDPERSCWLGGARLASGWPEVVREFGVTKAEYEEFGSAWVARRFVGGGSGKGP